MTDNSIIATHTLAARIYLLPALAAPYVVVIRRKPSKCYHIMLWNTQTDEIKYGAWFWGKIYAERSDLSPDGRHLVFFAYGNNGSIKTSVCAPPMLKSIFMTQEVDAHLGGGFWQNDQYLSWNSPAIGKTPMHTEIEAMEQKIKNYQLSFPIPAKDFQDYKQVQADLKKKKDELRKYLAEKRKLPFRIVPYTLEKSILDARFERDGWIKQGVTPEAVRVGTDWVVENDPGWAMKPTSQHPTLHYYFKGYYPNEGHRHRFALDEYPDLLNHGVVTWACWDCAGQLLVARDGAIEKYTLQSLRENKPVFVFNMEHLSAPNNKKE